MIRRNNMDISTLCIHGSDDASQTTGSVTVPIYQTATFVHPAVGQSTGYDYSRVQNQTILAGREWGLSGDPEG
jgi:cystathionine gamma-synthase